MPIYMDRHDVAETITAEIVAQIHQEDLKIQDEFDCRGLTYWFDDKRKTAFCLIEAPDINAIREMHKKAHGQVPHSVIEVDAGIVESFLGRITDPEKAQDTTLNIINDPAFRTIAVVTLNHSGPKSNGDYKTVDFLHQFNSYIPGIIGLYGEKPVKQTQNYCLASFRSVSDAVRAALDIQSKFREFKDETGREINLEVEPGKFMVINSCSVV